MATTVYTNPIATNQNTIKHDIYGTSFDSTVEIYNALANFAASEDDDGKVTLPSGQEIDVTTISGMTTYSTYLQFLQAHKEVIDNVFVFVKNLENKLDNLLSS
jgi:tRNA A22 N-methylase